MALYGAGAVHTVKGGTGSGDVNERRSVTVREGMEAAGFDIRSAAWLDAYEEVYAKARADSLKASTFAHVAPTLPAPTTVTFDIILYI